MNNESVKDDEKENGKSQWKKLSLVQVVAKTKTSTDSWWGEETSQMPWVKPSEMK